MPLEFTDNSKRFFALLKASDRDAEGVRVCESVGADRTQIGQLEMGAKHLKIFDWVKQIISEITSRI